MMNNEPKFEVWGNWDDGVDYCTAYEHLEDCFTYEEAMTMVEHYNAAGWTVYICSKETGEIVDE